MIIAQTYARLNRLTILQNICEATGLRSVEYFETIHNYINLTDGIIRKGAVSAHGGERLVIPLNMADGMLVCEGKGEPDWNYSAPHGAGRMHSRGKAKELLSMEAFRQRMMGIYISNLSESLLDESPMAYKDADEIINNISDTVFIEDRLNSVLNIKA